MWVTFVVQFDDISYPGSQGPYYFGDAYLVFITRATDKGEAFLLPNFPKQFDIQ